MREIEFRAKAINRDPNREYRTDYKNGDWVYGLITDLGNEKYNAPAQMTNEIGVEKIDIDYKTIGQYTGLKDKYGNKVFEGDILRYLRTNMYAPTTSFHNKDLLSLHIICWNNEKYAFYERHYTLPEKKCIGGGSLHFNDERADENTIEIIGNIYDNPELLEGLE